MRALPGLLDAWSEAGVADELARRREPGDLTDLGGEREREQLGDARDRHQQLGALVAARERAQLTLERRELAIEVVNDAEQRPDRLQPDLRHPVLGELVDRTRLAQRGD